MSGESQPITEGAEGYPSTLVRGDSRLIELQHERATEYVELSKAIHTDTKRKILHALVDTPRNVSYTDLEAITTVSRRTLRNHVSDLEDACIVTRTDANYSIIEFVDIEVRALAQHWLYCWEAQLQH